MHSVKPLEPLAVEDYLAREQRSEIRHEYVNGLVYAMVGGTARHNQICLTIAATLRQHLRGKPCRVFMSDMKVLAGMAFYYPDVMVVCGEGNPAALYETDPVLLVEVLSESTEARDRLEKFVAYQGLRGLEEYLLVAQDKVRVDIYRHLGDGWQAEVLSDGDEIRLESIDFVAPAELFYEDVLGSMAKRGA